MRRDTGVVGVALWLFLSPSSFLPRPLPTPRSRMRIPAPGAVLFDPGIRRPVAVLLSWLELGKWGNPARGNTGFRTDCTGGAGRKCQAGVGEREALPQAG